jgi:glucose/arabinose dehydrogenase
VRLAAVLLAGLALLAAGCGDDGDGDPTTTATTPPATSEAAAPTEPSAPSTEAETTEGEAPSSEAAPSGREPVLVPVADGFDSPVLATAPPDDPRLFVVEQTGRIWILDDGRRTQETPFLDLSAEVGTGGERGLLGLAFAPDFASSGVFVVNYTNVDGNTRVVRYRAEGDRADPGSAEELLAIEQPYPNHNGGHVLFGPDGLLWVGTGDGGSGGDPEDRAQDPGSLLGKMLRLDVSQPGAEPEIWALGLRNPWRYAFDPETGDLWIGDVGQGAIEEIDHVPSTLPAGVNFGWRRFEGTERFDDEEPPPDPVMPVAEYTHDDGCSVTGGEVVRDGGPWDGRYVYGDYCSGQLWTLDADAEGAEPEDVTEQLGALEGLTSFGRDGQGRITLTVADGRVLRLGAE